MVEEYNYYKYIIYMYGRLISVNYVIMIEANDSRSLSHS